MKLKDELWKLAQEDATVRAYMELDKRTDIPYTEILETLVLNLQNEKKCYFNMAVSAKQHCTEVHLKVKGAEPL